MSIPKKFPLFSAISIGPSFGIFVKNNKIVYGAGYGAAKFGFAEDFMKIYGGQHEIAVEKKIFFDQTY